MEADRIAQSNITVTIIAAAALAVAACTAGSPLHFKSKGDIWQIPVASSPTSPEVVAQVKVNGKGPFLFAIRFNDRSTIHPELAKRLDLWQTTDTSSRMIGDKSGKSLSSQLAYAQVDSLEVGDLKMGGMRMVMLANGGVIEGVPILGVIGADLLSETTIWHLDRDQGVFTVANQNHFEPPPEADRVAITIHQGELFTNIHVDGREVYVRVRFDGPTTIRPGIARKLQLAPGGDSRWIAGEVSVGDVQAGDLLFGPYIEQRRVQNPIEGELGLQFWSRYNLTINLHQKAVWVTPRRKP